MADNRTTVAVSVTLNKQTKAVIDLICTPAGFFEPPKGSYSQLINGLLNGYMEKTLGTDMLTILDHIQENPDVSLDELKQHCANAAIS